MAPSDFLDNLEELAEADRRFLAMALEEARRAYARDEVPIGAVVVGEARVLARAHNLTRLRRDPTAHAELLALVQATTRTGDMRLPGATVYSTVEPCFMCAGALVHARIARVVWAVPDPKFGGCASLGRVLDVQGANHRVLGQALDPAAAEAQEARQLLQSFFQSKRARPGPPPGSEQQDRA